MAKRNTFWFWLGGLVLLVGCLALVSEILLPFVVGMLVAYFLDPAADKLEKAGCSRSLATAIIIVGFFAVLIIALALLVPPLSEQLVALAKNIPGYITGLQEVIQKRYGTLIHQWVAMANKVSDQAAALPLPANLDEKAAQTSDAVLGYVGKFAAGVWQSSVAFLNLMSLIIISPVVAFYMLRDFDRMTAKVDGWLPRDHAATIRGLLKQMDDTLSGFVRGVSNVCLILGIIYATGLSLVGVQFGLLIGFGAGLLSFIPFVGCASGLITSLTVAFFQFDGDTAHLLMVLGVFGVGQLLEGNFLTPLMVGNKVNLHPVWMIFGLLAGGALFGFTGVVVAVPVTAVLGVLMRFAIGEYMKSGYYRGEGRRVKGRARA